ncbi:MAG: EAL domain-containing protein [Firmicutes bacterium]|nr:EAL domain-containing protein [Bacillota bacterium]
MSGIDIVDLTQIVPYFQPVVAIDEQEVVGYEALGRLLTLDGPRSLGPFFHDPAVDPAQRRTVDDHLLRQAAQRMSGWKTAGWLFLNFDPDRLAAGGDAAALARHLQTAGLSPDRVVLEVGERAFNVQDAVIRRAFAAYRRAGFLLALDDVGAEASNLLRMATLAPDILKVDRSLVAGAPRNSAFRAVLDALAVAADKMGAALLLEGVETEEELALAVDTGARYVQGFFFAPALPQPAGRYRFAAQVVLAVQTVRDRRQFLLTARARLARRLDAALTGCWESWHDRVPWPPPADARCLYNALGTACLDQLPPCCYRLYICDRLGWQLSANIERRGREATVAAAGPHRVNWAARPYFLPNVRAAGRGQPALSEPYADRHSRRRTVTFTRHLGAERYLFVDVDLSAALAAEAGAAARRPPPASVP